MKKIILFVVLVFNLDVFAQELSFDCEGIYTNPNTGVKSASTTKLDFDLGKLSGTRENDLGRITSFARVELTPGFLRGFEVYDWSPAKDPHETVFIDRNTLESKVNGAIGKCKIVKRNEERKF